MDKDGGWPDVMHCMIFHVRGRGAGARPARARRHQRRDADLQQPIIRIRITMTMSITMRTMVTSIVMIKIMRIMGVNCGDLLGSPKHKKSVFFGIARFKR